MSAPTSDRFCAHFEPCGNCHRCAPAPDPDAVERERVPVSNPGQCCRVGYCIEADAGEVHELTRDQADRVVDMLARRSPRPAAVSEEAVEAAAESIEDDAMRWLGRDLGTIHRDDIARNALTAALPHLAPGQSEATRPEHVVKAEALREAAEAADAEWLSLKPGGWGSTLTDQQTIQFAVDARRWLQDRADALARTAPAEDGAE